MMDAGFRGLRDAVRAFTGQPWFTPRPSSSWRCESAPRFRLRCAESEYRSPAAHPTPLCSRGSTSTSGRHFCSADPPALSRSPYPVRRGELSSVMLRDRDKAPPGKLCRPLLTKSANVQPKETTSPPVRRIHPDRSHPPIREQYFDEKSGLAA